MASRRKGRILAFQALYSWDISSVSTGDLLDFAWLDAEKRESLDESTAVFSRHLIMGTIEHMEEIDREIKNHLKNWDFSRLNKVDLAILRMSAFSLLFQDDISPSIVIDEAIDISREFGTDESYRFINGVLDAIRKSRPGDKKGSATAT